MTSPDLIVFPEYVHGPADNWHLTCSGCRSAIHSGALAEVSETASGDYVRARCAKCADLH